MVIFYVCGFTTQLEPILKRIKANLTLHFFLFSNLSTPLYQCINSKCGLVLRNNILWERIRKTSAFYFLKFGGGFFLGWARKNSKLKPEIDSLGLCDIYSLVIIYRSG